MAQHLPLLLWFLQAEQELEALRHELQQQQHELSKRAEALAAAAKEGAAQVCAVANRFNCLLFYICDHSRR